MSDAGPGTRSRQRTSPKESVVIEPAKPARPATAPATAIAREISALVRVAELDATLLERRDGHRTPVCDKVADECGRLRARLSPEILEAYNRALSAGRRPAVVRMVASVCSGCHVRLHSTLEQKIRRRRGAGPCPHCLRLVYDPAWLDGAESRR